MSKKYKITHEIYKGRILTDSMPKSIKCKCGHSMEMINGSYSDDIGYQNSAWYCKPCGNAIVHHWIGDIEEYTREAKL